MNQITIETQHGPAAVQITDHLLQRQYNCFMPPAGGAGVFAVMPDGIADRQCRDIFRELLELGPHQPDTDLTDKASSIVIAAGSVNMDQVVGMALNRVKESRHRIDIEDCPDCRPGVQGREMTAADYQRALDMLRSREDLTGEQRQQAQDWLDTQATALNERDE